MFKVLHVNYSDMIGGAAIGVNRLHTALLKNGIDSKYHLLKEGDFFHVNPGDYHYIENNTSGDYTIAINLDYEISSDVLSNWEYMWKNGGEWNT